MEAREGDRRSILPSVDEVLTRLAGRGWPHDLVVAETRRVLAGLRERIGAGEAVGEPDVAGRVAESLEGLSRPSLRRVINATGVVLHTNMGRAPQAPGTGAAGYSNLEFDLQSGRRGRRDVHVAGLFERLLGRPAIVVNNNAAAVWLALNELASGREALISRGELIEIGDGFRIPDIMALSGAVIREVGTTNRTRVDDYRAAFSERTALILRVHPSNFRMSGFTERPALEDMVELANSRGVPLYEDLGSGCLVDLSPYGIDEPLVRDSLDAGVSLVSFSGDKLPGGPQAGILAGEPEIVTRLRRNPMFRALRVDKLIYAALEATLRSTLFGEWKEIPALRMIATPAEEIRKRAETLAAAVDAEVIAGQSVIGGGSTPEQSIPTWLVAIRRPDVAALERRLRGADPPVVARIAGETLLLDLRTVLPSEEEQLLSGLRDAMSGAL